MTLATRPRRRKAAWTPPVPDDFAIPGQILCFDQTLNNTGVAILRCDPHLGLSVDYTAMLRPAATDLVSNEGTYAKAVDIDRQIAEQITRFRLYAANPRAIAYERPPVSGFRGESILLAGFSVAKYGGDQAHLVSNTHAKAVLLGPRAKTAPKWTKEDVKLGVESLVHRPDPAMPWNEHVRDAIMLGLAHLFDEVKAAAR